MCVVVLGLEGKIILVGCKSWLWYPMEDTDKDGVVVGNIL